ncbi:BgTH12-03266 [Blumeria graminis f. sp. triticale]|uniref:BgtE-20067 n=3 Tax=Blumeria graminis TaxID=34373 RepID=A0A9X9MJQ7_BLUGR|nr:BgTH12-03266 [Blumeria graminis f. sp. triticale]VDB89754.1 BgtE-20067 [Blumeria graminis f. sp. tritici]
MTPLKYLALIAFTIVHEVSGTWTIDKGINCDGVEYSGQNLEQFLNMRCSSQRQGSYGLNDYSHPREALDDGTGISLYFIRLPTVSQGGTMHYDVPSTYYLAVNEHCVFYYGAKISQPLRDNQLVTSNQIERCVALTGYY